MKRITKSLLIGLICITVLTSCAPATAPTMYAPPTPINDHLPTVFDIEIESPASSKRLNDPRPNIIVVLTDDQPYHTVDYMPAVKNQYRKPLADGR